MNKMQKQVVEFHQKFSRPVNISPGFNNPELRVALIKEEFEETVAAIAKRDLVETADGLCDLLYVCFGAAIEFGIDLEPLFNEVHKTNLLKSGGTTRVDGKIMKPANWQPPRIAELLEEQKAKATRFFNEYGQTELSYERLSDNV